MKDSGEEWRNFHLIYQQWPSSIRSSIQPSIQSSIWSSNQSSIQSSNHLFIHLFNLLSSINLSIHHSSSYPTSHGLGSAAAVQQGSWWRFQTLLFCSVNRTCPQMLSWSVSCCVDMDIIHADPKVNTAPLIPRGNNRDCVRSDGAPLPRPTNATSNI